jgi:hypothetical protein
VRRQGNISQPIWRMQGRRKRFSPAGQKTKSAGIPRMINRVCEKTLMYACWQQKQLLDEHMVRFVADHEMLGGAG